MVFLVDLFKSAIGLNHHYICYKTQKKVGCNPTANHLFISFPVASVLFKLSTVNSQQSTVNGQQSTVNIIPVQPELILLVIDLLK